MKRLLILSLALATGLFAPASRADVDVHIGIGVPGVIIGTPHHPRIHHHHYHPPVRHYYGPPVVYYPEKVYKRGHKHRHHAHPHYRKGAHDCHLRHGHRPVSPPHARAHGHWSR